MKNLILPMLFQILVVIGYMQKELIAATFQANPYKVCAELVSIRKNAMPAWKQAFTPVEIWDLVSYIRLKSKKAAKTSQLTF